MNKNLSEEQLDAYLEFLHRAILHARGACWNKHADEAEAILDMLHNLPIFLKGSNEPSFASWSVKGYYDLFVAGIPTKYPHLRGVTDMVPRE